MANKISPAICNLCEAECGILVEHDEREVLGIRGDRNHPLSRGYICPKAAALADLHRDPDRLRTPMQRIGPDSWKEVPWDQALDDIADRLLDIQATHGNSAVATYMGNPTVHSHGAVLYGLLLRKALRTRQAYSSNSMDALPRMLTSYLMYGSQAMLPVPDIERTHHWLILGANPAVSNGSVMTAPGCKRRIKELRRRGGTVTVIDPRRTETAALADRHVFIRPGTDALLLCAMLRTIFDSQRQSPGRLAPMLGDLSPLRALVDDFTPERVSFATGIPGQHIIEITDEFVRAPSAVCYGRMGTCAQEFGVLTTWLIDCLNIVTGNFDRPGGAMFPTPAVDLTQVAALIGERGSFGRWRSPVNDLPEFAGELPIAGLADEIESSGEKRIRALITHAGNPVLSAPNGARLERALPGLAFMVSIDIYRNETTRHADYILPSTMILERDHYSLVFNALAVRNNARISRAVFNPPARMRHDWQILGGLARRLLAGRSRAHKLAGLLASPVLELGPNAIVELGLRTGAHRLSLRELDANPHGIDLGPLVPRLPGLLGRRRGQIRLLPEPMVEDMNRLRATFGRDSQTSPTLTLITRRELRSANTWLHNSHRLVKGKDRCVLHIHPQDAAARSITDGAQVIVRSRVGSLQVSAQVTEDMMPGVVSMPFGWGHDRQGTQLSVAAKHAGVSLNDITDETRIDTLSGCTRFDLPVQVAAVQSSMA